MVIHITKPFRKGEPLSRKSNVFANTFAASIEEKDSMWGLDSSRVPGLPPHIMAMRIPKEGAFHFIIESRPLHALTPDTARCCYLATWKWCVTPLQECCCHISRKPSSLLNETLQVRFPALPWGISLVDGLGVHVLCLSSVIRPQVRGGQRILSTFSVWDLKLLPPTQGTCVKVQAVCVETYSTIGCSSGSLCRNLLHYRLQFRQSV